MPALSKKGVEDVQEKNESFFDKEKMGGMTEFNL